MADHTRRRRYNVGARKIDPGDRDIAHSAITPDDDRRFRDVIDADDDPTVPLGAPVVYSVELSDTEAERFRRASNARYVEADEADTVDEVEVIAAVGTDPVPPQSTLTYMGAVFDSAEQWHGADVTVGVLDGGTTKPVKDRFGWYLAAQRNFVHPDADPYAITVEHGCYVTPEAVPAHGRLVEAVVFDETGTAYHSVTAAAMKWAADSGAKVINYSGSGSSGSATQQDALNYLRERGVVLVCSAGNDGQPRLGYPAKYCETYENVCSSLAFVEATDHRADFSNHLDTGSGAAPGQRCLSVNKHAENIYWSGTSSSSPKMALLVAMGHTREVYSALAVARALEVNARDTPEPVIEEGAGAWHLQRALRKLGAFGDPLPPPEPEPVPEPAPSPTPEPEPDPAPRLGGCASALARASSAALRAVVRQRLRTEGRIQRRTR